MSAIHSSVKELELRAGEMNENKCLIALTVNPLLSHPGGLFIQDTFEGWLIREGRLNREGLLIDLAKCSTIGLYDMILYSNIAISGLNLNVTIRLFFPIKWFVPGLYQRQ